MTYGPSKFFFAVALVLCTAIAVRTAQAGEHRRHEAHEHGVARMNVAVEGNALVIELFSPAVNIVGFEHHPRSHLQKEKVKDARQELAAAEALFQLPPKAQARLVKSAVETDIDSDSDDKSDTLHNPEQAEGHEKVKTPDNDHQYKEHAHEHHSDFHAEYHFVCQKPEKLTYMDVMLFHVYPTIERIEVQILTDARQTGQELTTKDNRIRF
jgi:hypothetical protein